MGDIPEYPPITHHCDCCDCEIEDEETVYEVEPFVFYCEDCFMQWIHDNADAKQLAEAFDVTIRKAYET